VNRSIDLKVKPRTRAMQHLLRESRSAHRNVSNRHVDPRFFANYQRGELSRSTPVRRARYNYARARAKRLAVLHPRGNGESTNDRRRYSHTYAVTFPRALTSARLPRADSLARYTRARYTYVNWIKRRYARSASFLQRARNHGDCVETNATERKGGRGRKH